MHHDIHSYMHTCTHTDHNLKYTMWHIYIHTCNVMHTCSIHTCIHACMPRIHAYTTYTHTRRHTYAHTAGIYTCIHTYIHTYIHTCIHARWNYAQVEEREPHTSWCTSAWSNSTRKDIFFGAFWAQILRLRLIYWILYNQLVTRFTRWFWEIYTGQVGSGTRLL